MITLAVAGPLSFLSPAQAAALSLICGVIAVATAAVVAVPQVIRVLRTGDADGISAASAGFTVISCAGWTLYGVIEHIPWTIVSCAAAFTGWAPLLVLLARKGCWSPRSRLGAAALSITLLALLFTRGPAVYGLALVGLGVLQCAPQVRVVLTSSALTGISLTSQIVYFLCAIGNMGIGLLASDLPLIAWSGTFMASIAIVVFRRVQTDPALLAAVTHPVTHGRIAGGAEG